MNEYGEISFKIYHPIILTNIKSNECFCFGYCCVDRGIEMNETYYYGIDSLLFFSIHIILGISSVEL